MGGTLRLIIPAAGTGARLGRPEPKALVPVAGIPLIVRTLNAFAPVGLLDTALVVHPPQFRDAFEDALQAAFPGTGAQLVEGGRERQDSVRIGLDQINDDRVELVVLHDAARPFILLATIQEAIAAAQAHGGATVATPAVDTILQSDIDEMLVATPDRTRLWACQTPQVFRFKPFREAHQRAHAERRYFTDDATLYKHYGGRVKIVQGSPENRKITTEEDLHYAEYRLGRIQKGTQFSG